MHNLIKQKILRTIYLKNEINNQIKKTLKKNQNQDVTKHIYYNSFLNTNTSNTSVVKQFNRCLQNGRTGGVYRPFTLGRHTLKKMINKGALQNVKICSW